MRQIFTKICLGTLFHYWLRPTLVFISALFYHDSILVRKASDSAGSTALSTLKIWHCWEIVWFCAPAFFPDHWQSRGIRSSTGAYNVVNLAVNEFNDNINKLTLKVNKKYSVFDVFTFRQIHFQRKNQERESKEQKYDHGATVIWF